MILTDTHSHVFTEEFTNDRQACYDRAMAAGVSRVFVPNIDTHTIDATLGICKSYPSNYFPMMGLHPGSVGKDFKTDLEIIYSALNENTYYGIGEIGIDLYWDKTTFPWQKEAFIEQAKWAIEKDLPVSVHSREATRELIDIINQNNLKHLRGIFHCFTGDTEEANTLISMGFYLGIGGVITYKKSGLPEVIKSVGASRLVLETDAPYLPPVPFRGKRNEPAYLVYTAGFLGEVLELPIEDIAEITTNNSREIFGI